MLDWFRELPVNFRVVLSIGMVFAVWVDGLPAFLACALTLVVITLFMDS